MITITVQQGQTLEDIALEKYGCFEGIATLLQDNNLAPDSPMYVGRVLQLREDVPSLTPNNKNIAVEMAKQGYGVNSGVNNEVNDGLYVEDGYVEDGYFEIEL